MSYELKRLECEVERLKFEDEFVREKVVFSSVAIDDLIYFTTVTPEPLGNSDKPYHFRSRLEKQRTCLTLLFCLKKCYPSIYQYLRTKICEPVILENGFQWVEQKNKKGLIGKMKNVLGKQEQHVWWASKPQINNLTKEIDQELIRHKRRLERNVKLLIMGNGESGKSTVMKQFRLQYMNGFSKRNRFWYKDVINSNVIEAMQSLVSGCDELGIEFQDTELKNLAKKIEDTSSIETKVDEKLGRELKKLWQSVEIQQSYEQRAQLHLQSNASYFLDHIDRISSTDFVPTDDDILRARARTTGINQIEFEMEDFHFTAVDVGGARSERKKWAHCFEDVTAIVFVVDMNSFDEKLYNVNRIQEARKLFDDIVNSKWFQSTNVILLLNKSDLFREKIARTDLKCCFSDYKGGKDYEEASKFMRHKFRKLNRRSGRDIYAHFCCALDIEGMSVVFRAIKDSLIRSTMRLAD